MNCREISEVRECVWLILGGNYDRKCFPFAMFLRRWSVFRPCCYVSAAIDRFLAAVNPMKVPKDHCREAGKPLAMVGFVV